MTSATQLSDATLETFRDARDALAVWHAAILGVVEAVQVSLGPGASSVDVTALSPLGASAVAALETVTSVAAPRSDAGQFDVLENAALGASIMVDIERVAQLLQAGADTAEIRRQGGEIAGRLQRLLDEAVLRQVDGVVEPFVTFVADNQAVFGVGGAGPNPTTTADILGDVAAALDAALDYVSGESMTLIDVASTFESLATDLYEFPVDTTDEVLDAIDSVRQDMRVVREVSTNVDVLVDATVGFSTHTSAMAARLPELVELVADLVDGHLQEAMALFDNLMHWQGEVEAHVLPANANAAELVDRFTARVGAVTSKMGLTAMLADLRRNVTDFRNVFLPGLNLQVDDWKDVVSMANELGDLVRAYDADNTLKIGELAHAMTTALIGIEMVELQTAKILGLATTGQTLLEGVLGVKNVAAPLVASLPDATRARVAFQAIEDSSSELVQLLQTLQGGVAEELLEMSVEIDDMLARVAGYLDVHTRHQLLLLTQSERVERSTKAVSDILERRYRISELSHLFRADSHVPTVAAASMRRFADRFLGGLDSELAFIDASELLAGLPPACAADFTSFVPLDARSAAHEAASAFPQFRHWLDTMETVAAELPELAAVSRIQHCSEGATCSVSLIASRLGEVRTSLGSMQSSLAAFLDVHARVADVAASLSSVAECHTAVLTSIDHWVVSSDGMMTGQLVPLPSGTLSDAVDVGLGMQADTDLMTVRLDAALETLRQDVAATRVASTQLLVQGTDIHGSLSETITWMQRRQATLDQLAEVGGVLADHAAYLVETQLVRDQLAPLFADSADYVRLPSMRTAGYWSSVSQDVLDLAAEMIGVRNVLDEKREVFSELLSTLYETEHPEAGVELDSYRTLTYCHSEELCIRQIPRSTPHYNSRVFPGLTNRFWYETIRWNDPDGFVRRRALSYRCLAASRAGRTVL